MLMFVVDPDSAQSLLDIEAKELEEDTKKAAHVFPFFGKLFTMAYVGLC